MGVADMTSRCVPGLARRRASRWSTPKRCCSSTTARASSAKPTFSESSACVPTAIPASPEARASSASRRAAVLSEPVTSATLVAGPSPAPRVPASARGPIRRSRARWCWAASTSVGATRAAWPPASTTCSIARRATSVLPAPTSPCSSRLIGASRASSADSCSPTATWPGVSANGRRASRASSRPPGRGGRGTAGTARSRSRRQASAAWTSSASRRASAVRAGPVAATSCGACRSRYAWAVPGSGASRSSAAAASARIRSVSSSGIRPRSTVSSTRATAERTVHDGSFPVAR